MIKILFFLYSFGGGGAERTVVNIINNLDRSKFTPILVLGTDKQAPYLEDISSEIKIINLQKRKLRYCINSLKKCILDEKPEVMFSTVNPNNIVLAIAKLISFHNSKLILREANNRTESGKVSFFNKLMTFITYNYIADQIVALSEGVKIDLISNFKIREEKIRVIYNPVEVDYIKDVSNEMVDDFVFENGVKKIISVGRLVDQKDYPTLIRAFHMISKENIQLIILGIGSLEDKLKRMCIDLKIEDKVFFLGFKKNPYKYIKRADLFVLSSKWEGFGHVIVEAMACGVPVISTDCKSGPAEIIEENKSGALVPVGNYKALAEKIISLLENEELRELYRKYGEERAEKFSAKNIVKEYERIFDVDN